jgi:Fe-S cluster assembly ATP-binding protein
MKPLFAILDEPTAGIDMLSVQDMMNVIRSFKEGGASVLLITHQETIGLMADHASQLCGGRIIASGNPKEIADQYKKGSCIRCDGERCLPFTTAR